MQASNAGPGWWRVVFIKASGLVALAGIVALPVDGRAATCADPSVIIVDHRAVTDMALDRVPHEWLQAARSLAMHHYGASHAHQILQGALMLDAETRYDPDPMKQLHFACSVISPQSDGAAKCTVVSPTAPPVLPADTTALRLYFGNWLDSGYANWDGTCGYWDNQSQYNCPPKDGRQWTTRADQANGGLFDASAWTWCEQLAGSDQPALIQRYINTLTALDDDPTLRPRYILMTGYSFDDPYATTNNQAVRAAACLPGRILFDFADIDLHDPDGTEQYAPWATWWHSDWCAKNKNGQTTVPPGYCRNLNGNNDAIWDSAEYPCAHSDGNRDDKIVCKMKGQAFWWMMARLAGWDGGDLQADIRFSSRTTLSWNAVSGATRYNVYRGALTGLIDADQDGLPDDQYGTCQNAVDPVLTDTSFNDPTIPTTAQRGFFYLVSYLSGGVERGLGKTHAGLTRSVSPSCP